MINDKYCALRANYFLHCYVCTSCADSKRSVSDRWLINDKVKALAEINPQEPLIFTFFDAPFFLFGSFFFLNPLHLFKDKPSRFLRDES